MEWISVKDRFPEKNTYCVVWIERKNICYFRELLFNNKNKFCNFEMDLTEDVTHWMIPIKPKNI